MGRIEMYIDSMPESLIDERTSENAIGEYKKYLSKRFRKDLPAIIERTKKLSNIRTTNTNPCLNLLLESREAYTKGLFYSSIAMAGISAERYAIEISTKIVFKSSNKEIYLEDLFERLSQSQRIKILSDLGLIVSEIKIELDEINKIRNKYIHPKLIGDLEKDALIIVNRMAKIMEIEFNENYYIKEGKLVPKAKK
jgi:hypothetical protein